jgi:hypothetical protein
MAEARIIKFGETDCVVGLNWQFSPKRPKGLKRSHPHLILDDRATGTDLIEADGMVPFALLVAALCDDEKLCWVVDAGEGFFLGYVEHGLPVTRPEVFAGNVKDLEGQITRAMGSGYKTVATTTSLADMALPAEKRITLDPRGLGNAEFDRLSVAPPLMSRPARNRLLGAGSVAAAICAGLYVYDRVTEPEAEAAIPQVAFIVDSKAYLDACASAHEAGIPKPLGLQEESIGCMWAGSTDPAAEFLGLSGGGAYYRQFKVAPGHNPTIALRVAGYVFRDFEGRVILRPDGIWVADLFDVPLTTAPQQNTARSIMSRAQEGFVSSVSRFQEAGADGNRSLTFTSSLSFAAAVQKLKELGEGADIALLRGTGQGVAIHLVPPQKHLRIQLQEGAAHAL